MVSAAGIMANLFIATVAFIILKVMLMTGGFAAIPASTVKPVGLLLENFLIMNVSRGL